MFAKVLQFSHFVRITPSFFATILGGTLGRRPSASGGPQGPRPRHRLVPPQRQRHRQRLGRLRRQSMAHTRRGARQDPHGAHRRLGLSPETSWTCFVASDSAERAADGGQRQPGGNLERW
jgi:hypothetical protein